MPSPVQSLYNVLVPLSEGPEAHYALFNTLAGSLDVIDGAVASALDRLPSPRSQFAGEYARHGIVPLRRLAASARARAETWTAEVQEYLDRRGYLFESPSAEQKQARLLYETMMQLHRQSARQPIVVIPSYNCNLKCPYCWQRLYDMDSPIMQPEVAARLFQALPRFLDPAAPLDKVDIVIFGGEPLQDIPELRERVLQIAELARQMGLSTKVITNGVGLAPNVPFLKGHIDLLQVTMDGIGELHRKRRPLPSVNGRKCDSFAPMVEGITRAVEAGIRVNIRINLDAVNLPTLPDLADFMRDKGWLQSGLVRPYLAPVKNHNPKKTSTPETSLLRELKDLVARDSRMSIYDLTGFPGIKYFMGFKQSGMFSLHRFFNCEAQINFFAFDLHGDVYACWDAAGIKDLAVGRFTPDVLIHEDKLARWRGRTSLDIEGCQGCSSSTHCGGGCQFLAHEHEGTFEASACDSMMDGYVMSIVDDAEWLLARARAGDHAVGLVTRDRVVHAVNKPFGILNFEEDPSDLLIQCA